MSDISGLCRETQSRIHHVTRAVLAHACASPSHPHYLCPSPRPGAIWTLGWKPSQKGDCNLCRPFCSFTHQDMLQLCPISSGKRNWSKVHVQDTERTTRSGILGYGGSSCLAIMLLVHISVSVLELWINIILKMELFAWVLNSADHFYLGSYTSALDWPKGEHTYEVSFHLNHPNERCYFSLKLLPWQQCPYLTGLTHIRRHLHR